MRAADEPPAVPDHLHDVATGAQQLHGNHAAIAQLGERQTEDLKVPGSIPGLGTLCTSTVFRMHGSAMRAAVTRQSVLEDKITTFSACS